MQPEQICILQSDITTLAVDAIVNAANSSLLGGSGVDGAIHAAAGTALLKECQTLGSCPIGDAKITAGHNLPARFVIHTVGPVWQGGNKNEAEQLASCYRKSMDIAEEHNFETLAFPCISTGVFGYPLTAAGRIALTTIRTFENRSLKKVILVCFSDGDLQEYRRIYSNLFHQDSPPCLWTAPSTGNGDSDDI